LVVKIASAVVRLVVSVAIASAFAISAVLAREISVFNAVELVAELAST